MGITLLGKRYLFLQPQSVPFYSPLKIVRTLKSIVGREMFKRCPHVKKKLWGGEFWSDGYFVATVGQNGNAHTIANSVRDQGTGKEYQQLHAQPRATSGHRTTRALR